MGLMDMAETTPLFKALYQLLKDQGVFVSAIITHVSKYWAM